MYYKFLVKIPENSYKIRLNKKNDTTTYVEYIYERSYSREKGYTVNKRTTIGKLSMEDQSMMYPNQNYMKYFPGTEMPDDDERTTRSACLRIGAYTIIQKIIETYQLRNYLSSGLSEKETGFLLDLAAYTIISEDNAGQYYPDYAFSHPLLTPKMKIYSDASVSAFLKSITLEHSVDFLNSWNECQDHREKIYLSYDSTNKNTQAGDFEIAEFGKAKVDAGTPIFNYSIAYDTQNQKPLFYEAYPGSINDVAQLPYMLAKAKAYGYKNIGFILDRGYFSKDNLNFIEECGYSFVIMVKGRKQLVRDVITELKGTFEKKRANVIPEFEAYGTTVKRKIFESDKKERYFHIYYSLPKENFETGQLEAQLKKMALFMKKHQNEKRIFGEEFQKYYSLDYDEKGEQFLYFTERNDVIEEETGYHGYFAIVTSEKMTAKEALMLYKSRDSSEKLFRGDKSYLGNKSIRTHMDETSFAKIFIEFVALIIRCRIYTCLTEYKIKNDVRPNYMSVPAAIKELEKIEIVRQGDGIYRMDHAVTAVQKKILDAFGLKAEDVIKTAIDIGRELKKYEKK